MRAIVVQESCSSITLFDRVIDDKRASICVREGQELHKERFISMQNKTITLSEKICE